METLADLLIALCLHDDAKGLEGISNGQLCGARMERKRTGGNIGSSPTANLNVISTTNLPSIMLKLTRSKSGER